MTGMMKVPWSMPVGTLLDMTAAPACRRITSSGCAVVRDVARCRRARGPSSTCARAAPLAMPSRLVPLSSVGTLLPSPESRQPGAALASSSAALRSMVLPLFFTPGTASARRSQVWAGTMWVERSGAAPRMRETDRPRDDKHERR